MPSTIYDGIYKYNFSIYIQYIIAVTVHIWAALSQANPGAKAQRIPCCYYFERDFYVGMSMMSIIFITSKLKDLFDYDEFARACSGFPHSRE